MRRMSRDPWRRCVHFLPTAADGACDHGVVGDRSPIRSHAGGSNRDDVRFIAFGRTWKPNGGAVAGVETDAISARRDRRRLELQTALVGSSSNARVEPRLWIEVTSEPFTVEHDRQEHLDLERRAMHVEMADATPAAHGGKATAGGAV